LVSVIIRRAVTAKFEMSIVGVILVRPLAASRDVQFYLIEACVNARGRSGYRRDNVAENQTAELDDRLFDELPADAWMSRRMTARSSPSTNSTCRR
jgi:hypothetical protein